MPLNLELNTSEILMTEDLDLYLTTPNIKKTIKLAALF